jgi:hypothetical protein
MMTATPFWVEEILLLTVAWSGLCMWRMQRPAFHLFGPALFATFFATVFVSLQLIAYVDQSTAGFILGWCVATTLLLYILMMRDEFVRYARFVFPRARATYSAGSRGRRRGGADRASAK